MPSHFSEIDRKLISYLKAKGRFTTKDSIMAGKRRANPARPDLGDSWADVSSEDDTSDGAESLEIQESDDEAISPAAPAEEGRKPGTTTTPSPRQGNRASRQSLQPASHTLRTPMSTSPRKSPRLDSRGNSVEPEFIMPSMMASGSVKSTPIKSSPLSNSIRARKGRPLASSRTTLDHVVRDTPKRKPPKKSSKTSHSRQGNPLAALWSQVLRPVLGYVLGVVGYAMLHLKPLFGVLLAIFALFYGFKLAFNSTLGALTILPDITKIIPSPCSVPILNLLPMCRHSFPSGANPEFEDLMKVQSSFEDILESTAHGSILPIEMKRSEASIRDLKYVVTYSNLPSRGELVYEFQGFIDVARQASGDLIKFNSRVGRAVDHIIGTNKHTLQVIDGFVDTEASRGALSKLIWGSRGLTQDHLLKQYLHHTSQIEEEIQRLIVEATALLQILEGLDDRLDVIHGVVTRDGVTLRDSREELFAQLWTKLGGNRNSVQKLEQQMQMLVSVNKYRRAAWTHVTSTVLKLQAIAAGLEDLRERVAMPETVGIEFVPLQQHIETIQMGVERLEQVRDNSRREVGEGQRRVLDKGEPMLGKDRMVDGRTKIEV